VSSHVTGANFSRFVSSSEIFAFIDSIGVEYKVSANSSLVLNGIGDSREVAEGKIVFLREQDYKSVSTNLERCLVFIDAMPIGDDQAGNQFCLVEDPRATFIDVLTWLIDEIGVDPHYCGFSDNAVISPHAKIARSAVIEHGVAIGADSIVCDGAIIKAGSRIGSNVVVRENAVIGSEGITVYRAADGRLLKFPHVGGVSIGKNTEIGAGSVVSKGILRPTEIGDDVVIGNLCNIGHSAILGNGVWMSVGTLVGGHTQVRAQTTIGLGSRIKDNLVIGEGASLGMGSVVVKSVDPGHSVFGNPAKRMVNLKTGPKR
jgi:UDP-3-O-[3-hydroxymyristoyl] glucosamine N-acyltransferase